MSLELSGSWSSLKSLIWGSHEILNASIRLSRLGRGLLESFQALGLECVLCLGFRRVLGFSGLSSWLSEALKQQKGTSAVALPLVLCPPGCFNCRVFGGARGRGGGGGEAWTLHPKPWSPKL